jgi:hypothetical protein
MTQAATTANSGAPADSAISIAPLQVPQQASGGIRMTTEEPGGIRMEPTGGIDMMWVVGGAIVAVAIILILVMRNRGK